MKRSLYAAAYILILSGLPASLFAEKLGNRFLAGGNVTYLSVGESNAKFSSGFSGVGAGIAGQFEISQLWIASAYADFISMTSLQFNGSDLDMTYRSQFFYPITLLGGVQYSFFKAVPFKLMAMTGLTIFIADSFKFQDQSQNNSAFTDLIIPLQLAARYDFKKFSLWFSVSTGWNLTPGNPLDYSPFKVLSIHTRIHAGALTRLNFL